MISRHCCDQLRVLKLNHRPTQALLHSKIYIISSRSRYGSSKPLVVQATAAPQDFNFKTENQQLRVTKTQPLAFKPINDQEWETVWTMARPINMVPSYLLVILGAWAALGVTGLHSLNVWVMGIVSSGIAAASCIFNDYIDAPVDSVNSPNKPLPSGRISPEHALLFSGAAYLIVLLVACMFQDARVRITIAASAIITLCYTPILKRVSLIKNAAVAATIAAAPLAGALAAGAAGPQLHAVMQPCIFLFLCVCYREILMDIHDVKGDAEAGIKTLPVAIGRGPALGVGAMLLLGSLSLVINAAFTGHGLSWVSQQFSIQTEHLARRAAAMLGTAMMLRPIARAVSLYKNDFPDEEIGPAIDDTLKTIGAGMILLAALMH